MHPRKVNRAQLSQLTDLHSRQRDGKPKVNRRLQANIKLDLGMQVWALAGYSGADQTTLIRR